MNKTLKPLVLFTMGFCITITLLAQNQIPIELFGERDNIDSLSDLQRGDCSHQSELFDSNLLWLPKTNDEIKYVKVNFIFLHKDDGTGSFIQGNTEHEALINDLVTQINHVFSNLTNPAGTSCYMNEGFVSNVKVQISPNFIYIDSTKYWNNEGHPLHPDMWSGSWLDVLNSHTLTARPVPWLR